MPPSSDVGMYCRHPLTTTNLPAALRCRHPNVQRLLFSPCEKYMLTFSEFPDNRGRPHVSGSAPVV